MLAVEEVVVLIEEEELADLEELVLILEESVSMKLETVLELKHNRFL